MAAETRRMWLGTLGAAAVSACAAPARSPSAPDPPLVAAARRQVGVTTAYDPGYRVIGYPWGDVPRVTGACSDVIIRAARDAWRLDLQQLVHEDMKANFAAYPQRWGLPGPDTNIDHRRVPNLEAWWARHGAVLWRAAPRTADFAFQAGPLRVGDMLIWDFPTGAGAHVALVSQAGPAPYILQNVGLGAREDALPGRDLAAATCHVRSRPSRAARDL
ncbi:MAG TPA: DUF1287 domain-containing protein [Caulobacteraceae bacterium]|nr:DUF1287 domain-containing protein [Caulobacteraceae bacterium]